MIYRSIIAWAGFALLGMAAVTPAAAAQIASLDTAVTLETRTDGPRLIRLGSWENLASETLIDHVEIGGSIQPAHWEFQARDGVVTNALVQFVYECRNPHLRLVWEWKVRAAYGPIEHRILIQNLGAREIWLPLQPSFQFDFQAGPQEPLNRFWVEKGASSPSAEGTHLAALKDGDEWIGTSSTYAHPGKGEPREMIPYLLVERADNSRAGWYMGIEFSGRTRIAVRRQRVSVTGEAGLNPSPGPYRTRLAPGRSFETPTIFVGAFEGGPDGAGNILRRWIRETLNSPVTIRNTAYPMLVSNSWGSGMAIDERQARHMIDDASELGLEMFHLDAGWFRGVGDWVSDPVKFPDGVASVADYAHRMGLKFGLWTDWTQAGAGTEAGASDDWLTVTRPAGWKPKAFKGITMDIGVPAARQWAAAMVAKLVGAMHLDMLEHDGYLVAEGCERPDHPHAPLDPATAKRYQDEEFQWVEGANDTDVSYHATRAYYEIQAGLRRQFPALLFEICNDGGRMVDFGSAAHGDYFSITDAYDPVSNRKAFYDASYVLPPAMLETYVQKWPTPRLDNFRYMLRSGMMGWFTLMQDSTAWTPEQHEVARAEFALYKTKLRPMIRGADVYHVSERPDGVRWDGMEYFDPRKAAAVLFAFHGSWQLEDSHVFKPRGLRDFLNYRVSFQDGSSPTYLASGARIMREGVTVHEPVPDSSEIIWFLPLLDAGRH